MGLARHFDRVVATDGSREQLQHARPAPNVDYRCAPAEESGLPDRSVDLVTAAQALHWFNIDAFFREAQRVLVPGGVIAVWGYGDPSVDEPSLQAILHEFNRETLEHHWTLGQLTGLLRTWSATARYAAQHRRDPVIEVETALGRLKPGAPVAILHG